MMRTAEVLLAAGILVIGCGQGAEREAAPEPGIANVPKYTGAAAVEALQAADQRALEAFQRDDAAMMDALYAENAVLVNPGEEPLAGRLSIDSLHRDEMSRSDYELEWEPIRVEASKSGDLGYVYGRWSAHSTDSTESTDHGYYVNVYRKINGTWRTVVEVNASSTPDIP
jgi:ketosteroid isomerase-like protein